MNNLFVDPSSLDSFQTNALNMVARTLYSDYVQPMFGELDAWVRSYSGGDFDRYSDLVAFLKDKSNLRGYGEPILSTLMVAHWVVRLGSDVRGEPLDPPTARKFTRDLATFVYGTLLVPYHEGQETVFKRYVGKAMDAFNWEAGYSAQVRLFSRQFDLVVQHRPQDIYMGEIHRLILNTR